MGLVEFVVSPPDIVRSSNQLWLLKTWMRLRGASRLPALDGFLEKKLVGISDNLLLTEAVSRAGAVRYLIRFNGIRIAEYFGCTCGGGRGRFLDEVLPVAYRKAALSTFDQTVAAQEPVYTVADLRDRAGRIVHLERLLLPLSRDGAAVDGVLASIEAVSPEGVVDNRDLATSPSAPPAFAFCTIIDTHEPTIGASA